MAFYALLVRPSERNVRPSNSSYNFDIITHILIMPSSPQDAQIHGSVGLQATELHRGRCASNLCTGWPLDLCQMETDPSVKNIISRQAGLQLQFNTTHLQNR